MGKPSRTKGKRGELQVAELARACGFPDAERDWRTPQLNGDIRGIPGVHLEVRRRETLAVSRWCEEIEAAAEKSGEGRLPVLGFRRNDEPWRAALALDALLNLIRRAA